MKKPPNRHQVHSFVKKQTNRKGTEEEPCTGLGLIICKEFVEKNGGRLWIESE
jgi:signal transduction histidine kinase